MQNSLLKNLLKSLKDECRAWRQALDSPGLASQRTTEAVVVGGRTTHSHACALIVGVLINSKDLSGPDRAQIYVTALNLDRNNQVPEIRECIKKLLNAFAFPDID